MLRTLFFDILTFKQMYTVAINDQKLIIPVICKYVLVM